MNESETRAELIDPKLQGSGWGIVPDTKVLREHQITAGKIQTGGVRSKQQIADYVLVYKGRKLAVVEAKSNDLEVGEGVAQAKKYAEMLQLETTFSTNGKEIYQSFPHRMSCGLKPMVLKIIGVTLLTQFLLKALGAQREHVIIRKMQ